MIGFRLWFCIILTFCLAFVCSAQEKRFKDAAELFFVNRTGNTETTDLHFKNLMSYQFTEKFDGSWEVSIGYGETDDERTAENYSTQLKGNYALSERLYVSANTGWERDEFSGIDQRYYIGPGLGYKFFLGPEHFLLAEAGAQYVKEAYTDNTDDHFLEGRVLGSYKYNFTDETAFTQKLEFLSNLQSGNDYSINSLTAVTSDLNTWLYLKTSYEIKYDNNPTGDDIENTDIILSASLGIKF